MINRRTALGIIASASTIGASGVALAKEKSQGVTRNTFAHTEFFSV
jgi:hypothetical protein